LPVPLTWLHHLSLREKTTSEVLKYLADIPAEKRLVSLMSPTQLSDSFLSTAEKIQATQTISSDDLENLRSVFQYRTTAVKVKEVKKFAEVFLKPDEFGERLLEVMQSYYDVFFAEEEERILPVLKEGLKIAQKRSKTIPIAELLEELSHGVILEKTEIFNKTTLVPSYWTSPLIFYNKPQDDELLVIFGCRNETQNLVPGEYVPETLITGLKALADPTRLRILHYLNQGATTPSSLARRLRLRAPTVIHHLNTLRLARLIQVTITPDGERRYSLRQEAVDETYKQLNIVINPDKNKI
jgi:DNA-binding transcriptional ArsR family regulator